MTKNLIPADVRLDTRKRGAYIGVSRFEADVTPSSNVPFLLTWEVDICGSQTYKELEEVIVTISFKDAKTVGVRIEDIIPFRLGDLEVKLSLDEFPSEIVESNKLFDSISTTFNNNQATWTVTKQSLTEDANFCAKLQGAMTVRVSHKRAVLYPTLTIRARFNTDILPPKKTLTKRLTLNVTDKAPNVFYPIVCGSTVADFCRQLGLQDERFKKIDSLFVPPKQYGQISKILDTQHVVFITGDAGMGKTYTAMHLLYQLFRQGYDVYQPRSGREMDEFIGELVSSPKAALETNKATYIEDPFGRSSYQANDSLASSFRDIVAAAKRGRGRLIVTSRNVFFDTAIMGSQSQWTERTRVTLTLAAPESQDAAYDPDQLRTLFNNYVALYKPQWAEEDKRRDNIIAQKAVSNLLAPQNLEYFIQDSVEESYERALDQGIEASKVENIVKTFARTIEAEATYKTCYLVLLGLFFLSLDTAEQVYKRILQGLPENREVVRPTMAWQKCEELYVHKFKTESYAGQQFRRLYHPSLEEALGFAIKESANVYMVYEHILDSLVKDKNPFVARQAGSAILNRFPEILPSEKRILGDLIKHKEYLVRAGLPDGITLRWRELGTDQDARQTLTRWLEELAKDKAAWVVRNVALGIAKNLGTVDAPELHDLFGRLSDHEDAAVRYGVAESVIWHFDSVPKLFHKYLWKLENDPDIIAKGLFVDALVWQFPRISPHAEIIRILQESLNAGDQPIRGWAMCAIAWHQDSLDELGNEKAELLSHLKGRLHIEQMRPAAECIKWHYNYFAQYKPEFFGMLSGSYTPSEWSGIMQTLFLVEKHKFPDVVQHFFEKMSRQEEPSVRGWAAFAFTARLRAFPRRYRQRLQELAQDGSAETREIVAKCAAANFARDSVLMLEVLEQLAEDPIPAVRQAVAVAIESLESEVPPDTRRKLAIMLENT